MFSLDVFSHPVLVTHAVLLFLQPLPAGLPFDLPRMLRLSTRCIGIFAVV
jgi:hypothetical protein